MELGVVVGNIVSTIKHPAYNGTRLLLVENVDIDLKRTGTTTVVVDSVSAGIGDLVLVAREGRAAGDVLGLKEVPVRSVIVGIIDTMDAAGFYSLEVWGGATFDADGTFFPLMRTKQVLSHFSNEALDRLIDQGRSTMDRGKREKIYSEACKIFAEEVPWAFAYQQMDIYGVSERVTWKSRGDEKLIVYNMSFKK